MCKGDGPICGERGDNLQGWMSDALGRMSGRAGRATGDRVVVQGEMRTQKTELAPGQAMHGL